MGHPYSWRDEIGSFGFVDSHLRRKNKDAPKVGHPFSCLLGECKVGFVVSHPKRKMRV
jgi:hypothetical protein